MGRRVIEGGKRSARKIAADNLVAGFLGGKTTRKKTTGKSVKRLVEDAVKDVDRRIAEGQWDDIKPSFIVGLYVWCYVNVYGVQPSLNKKEWLAACAMAKRVIADEFGGDDHLMIGYVKWVWQREREREEWRRKNRKSGYVLGWRRLFSNQLLNEYRVEEARQNERQAFGH